MSAEEDLVVLFNPPRAVLPHNQLLAGLVAVAVAAR
jgi:hypothetical protein